MIGDLHIHTTFSDGSMTPREALVAAASRGLDYVSFVDHDTTAGSREAIALGLRIGVSVISGVEISAWDPLRARKVHILGYNYRLPATHIDALVGPTRHARDANTRRQLRELQAAGYRITEEAVLGHARGGPCLYKQHLMLALIDAGYTDEIYGELYRTLFKGGGVAAHDIEYVTARDAVRAIRADGGHAVLAHPGQLDSYDIVAELVGAGLDGIELFHEDHSSEDRRRVRALAAQHGLIVTGGSDDHGAYGSSLAMGDICAPAGSFERLTEPEDEEAAWATDLVRRVGAYTRRAVAEQVHVSLKSGNIKDLVTKHDLEADRLLTEAIRARFPDHGFLTEEAEHADLEPGQPVWVIDPIDGTTNFVTARGYFAISVALYEGSRPRFGIVFDVMADELYLGIAGKGAWLNGMRLGPVWAGVPKPERECVLECSLHAAEYFADQSETILRRLTGSFRAMRSNGSAALGICRIARETLDVYTSSNLSVWDYAAAQIVLREAGGAVETIAKPGQATDEFLHEDRRVVIAAGHDETLETIRGILTQPA